MIAEAARLGLSYYAITDHCDKDCAVLPDFGWVRQIDLEKRFEKLLRLRDLWAGKLDIAVGLEYGYLAEADTL